LFHSRSTSFPLFCRKVDADSLSGLIPSVVSKGFVVLGWKVWGHRHPDWLVKWYSDVFLQDRFLLLRFVLMLEIRIVVCQGGLLLLDDLFVVEQPHRLFVVLAAVPLNPGDHEELVAR